MALNFPSSPTVGDTYAFGDVEWTYTTNGWIGRTAIPTTAWGDVTSIPALVEDFGALSDPGQDSYLKWNDTTNQIEWTPIPDASNITVQGGGQNLNLWDMAGRPAGIVVVTLEVAVGAVISSLNPYSPALDLRGFASGSTINIVNHGAILGAGGAGGAGASVTTGGGSGDRSNIIENPTPGLGGGTAIYGPGAGITVSIDNTDGYVWGGGGGGGGGGATADDSAANSTALGGGGGAGAGGALGGFPGRIRSVANVVAGNPGVSSGYGTSSAAGAGGAGAQSASVATGGAGGAGGDWGTIGTVGVAPTTYGMDVAAGTPGAAGLAVNQNGGTVSFSAGGTSPNVEGAIT